MYDGVVCTTLHAPLGTVRCCSLQTHALSLRRAVAERSKSFDNLLLEHRAAKEALQKAKADTANSINCCLLGGAASMGLAGQPAMQASPPSAGHLPQLHTVFSNTTRQLPHKARATSKPAPATARYIQMCQMCAPLSSYCLSLDGIICFYSPLLIQ